MPEEITIEEARRRAAAAHMIIAECEASAALNEGKLADEGQRPTAVWHCTHGYIHHPVKYSRP